jgi:drug/metabolite transporter (DMT)-like permease
LLTASVYLLAATGVWGVLFPVAKRVLPHVDAFGLTLIRYGLPMLVMLPVLVLKEGAASLSFDGRALRAFLYGTTGFAGFSLLAFTGLKHTTPSHGAILVALMPLLTAIITAVGSRRLPPPYTLAGIAMALAGVALVVAGGDFHALFASTSLGGDAMILGGVLSWVIYTLGGRSFPDWSPLRYSTLTMGLGMLGVLAITLVALDAGVAATPTAADLAAVAPELVFIAVVSVLAVFAWNEGVRRLGPVNGALFINFVPISAFALQAALGEPVTRWELAGGALVIAALLFNNLMQRRAAATVSGGRVLAACRS